LHPLEAALHEVVDFFFVELLGDWRVPDSVGEKDGDDASLTFHRAVIASNGILDVLWRGLEWLEVIVSRSGCTYRSAAGVAEFSLSAKLRAAVSTDEG